MLGIMKTLPGVIVNTEQMKNPIPGLFPQMTGFLTSLKFYHDSFSTGDRSYYAFACHQKSITVEETVDDKRSCEAELRKHRK